MPVDNSTIKQQIDTDLGGKGYRGVTVAAVIRILKSVADWVQTAINTNLITWLRFGSTTQPPTNQETAYRMGKTLFGRSTDDGTVATSQFAGGVSMNGELLNPLTLFGLAPATEFLSTTTLDWNTLTRPGFYFIGGVGGWRANSNGPTGSNGYGVIQVYSIGNSNATFQIFTHPGGEQWCRMNYFGWGVWFSNRQFSQLGLGGAAMDSRFVLNLVGDMLLIGTATFNQQKNKIVVLNDATGNEHQYNGFGFTGLEMRYQAMGTQVDHVFYAGTSPATSVDLFRIRGNGNIGMGTSAPSSRLHLKGAAGHNQFRLETTYTPTGTSDPNGSVGDISRDDSFLYQKTSTGWKRSAIFSTF